MAIPMFPDSDVYRKYCAICDKVYKSHGWYVRHMEEHQNGKREQLPRPSLRPVSISM
jgi:hypothetical protein